MDGAKRAPGRLQAPLTPLGFGGAAIGNLYRAVSDEDAREAVAAALDAGVLYFDTAPHYGFGLSETRLGEALAALDPQGRAAISTKVGRLLEPVSGKAAGERHGFVDAEPYEPVFDYSYDAVMRSFEESLGRLRRDRIDILLAHDLGRATHGERHGHHLRSFLEGGHRALRTLKESGAVGAIGLGVNEWQVCEELMMAEVELDLVLLAGRYTLLEQGALDSFLPLCAAHDVQVVVGGPYNSGVLAPGGAEPRYDYAPAPPEVMARVRRLEAIAEAFAIPLAAAALQLPLAHPQVCAVIPGLASAAEAQQARVLVETPIPAGFWSALVEAGLLHPAAPVPGERLAA